MTISVDQARAAKARAGELAKALGPVTGVGLTRIDGSYALKINLLGPRPQGLPQQVDGVPVVYEVTGPIGKRG